jgi:O-antigen/teichoic acid export membrane protein
MAGIGSEAARVTKVLYIAGYQGSGSTVLQRVLGTMDGYVAAGELRNLWGRGFQQGVPCTCRRPLQECEHWRMVMARAFGGIDAQGIATLAGQTKRAGRFMRPLGFLPFGDRLAAGANRAYLEKLERLYRAVESVNHSSVIIDSSKSPWYGKLLRRIPGLQVHVLHLVRDPRGSDYSLLKRKHAGDRRYRRYSWLRGVLRWTATNMAAEVLLRPGDRYLRLRYEDFVEAPQQAMRRIAAFLGEEPTPFPAIDPDAVDIGEEHSHGGSGHRFDGEAIALRPDLDWHQELPATRKRAVAAAALPLMARYGYVGEIRGLGPAWRAFHLGTVLANRGLGSLLRLLLNVFIGRLLRAEGTGLYYLFVSWMQSIGMFSALGLPQYSLRSLSVLEGAGRKIASRRFLLAALSLATVAGLVVFAAIWLLSPELAAPLLGSQESAFVLRLASLGAIAFILLRILGRAQAARGKANLAVFIENNVVPAGLVAATSFALLAGLPWSTERFLWIYLAIAAAAAGWALWLALRPRGGSDPPDQARQPAASFFDSRSMLRFWSLGFALAATNNLPFLLLPQFAPAAQIGLFGVAHRFATLAVTILDGLTVFFGPRFAKAFARGDASTLRRELRQSQLYSLLAYLPIAVAFILLGRPLLGVVGPEFREARNLLLIMLIGQLINAATGLSGILLQMTYREGQTLAVTISSLIVSGLSVVALGSRFGVVGVAWAQTLVVGLRHLMIYGLAWTVVRRVESFQPGDIKS